MNRVPRISIVTISYNQAPFLSACIASVLFQKREGLDEHIVVDPGSTDGSRDIIAAHSKGIDQRILTPDRGPADGLNKGFAIAQGDIFGYINADDCLARGALEFVSNFFATHPEIDVLLGAIRIVDQYGRARVRKRTADDFDLRRYIAGVCTVGQQATFFRRSAFEKTGGFNVDNRISWDGELLVDLALANCRFQSVPRVLGEFRIHADSITGSGLHGHRFAAESKRLHSKVVKHGIEPYSPAKSRLLRYCYKANPVRHLQYLKVR